MSERYLGGGVYFEQKNVSQEFGEVTPSPAASTLAELTDVNISNPTDGQTLVYNATSGKWENGATSGGGNVVVVDVEVTTESDVSTVTFDKTFAELKSAYEGGAVLLCNVLTSDNDNSVYGRSIAFLTYRSASQFPLPTPESFAFAVSFLQIGGDVHGCYVTCSIHAEGASVAVHTVPLVAAD